MSVVTPRQELPSAAGSSRSYLSPPFLSPSPPIDNDSRPISSIQSEDAAGSIFDLYTSEEADHMDETPTNAFPPALAAPQPSSSAARDLLLRQPTKDDLSSLPDVVIGDLGPTGEMTSFSNRSSLSAGTVSSSAGDGGGGESTSARSSVPPDVRRLHPRSTSNKLSVSQTTSVNSSGSIQGHEEEEDSFLVRSTYARLEKTGVSGDGWEDGVERTRERSKLGRQSMLFQAETADGLGEQEKKMRTTLDRYGFFPSAMSQRSESRIFAIPPSSLSPPSLSSKRSSRSSLPRSASPAPSSLSSPKGDESSNKGKEVERIAKWDRMLVRSRKDEGGNVVQWGWAAGKKDKVSRRVYKGIPDRWRASAWETLASDYALSTPVGKGKRRSTTDDLLAEYARRVDQPSSFDVQIDLDVPRTVSGHVLFHTRYGLGQRSLFHSLHVFSLKCDDCQYCQGMGSIAANLLCYYSAERTYTLLVRLHDDYGLHSIFSPGFPGMLEAFYVQERLIESLMPEVFDALKKEMISTSSFATKWYITLFSTTLPFQTQLRVWDVFFLEGPDMLIVVSLAIIWSFRDNITSPEANFETMLSLLSSFFIPSDDDAFLRWIQTTLGLKGVRAKMNGWRREWADLELKGEAMDKLL